MRGATISLRALSASCSSDHSKSPSGTPRTVVIPCASQSLKAYSPCGAFGTPPLCTWLSMKPGITYIPVASISRVAPEGRPSARIGRPGKPTLAIRAMRFPSMTMSTGPRGGAPVPSMSVAARRMSRWCGPSPSPAVRRVVGSMSCAREPPAVSASKPSASPARAMVCLSRIAPPLE